MTKQTPETMVQSLSGIFQPAKLKASWKDVRQGLRDEILTDLSSYRDFDQRQDEWLSQLAEEVRQGRYRPKAVDVVTEEKKLGVTRKFILPSPDDALVLQALSDALESSILGRQPHDRSFYNRSNGHTKGVRGFQGIAGYPWWIQWPEFQKQVLKLTRMTSHMVMTDLVNYYDSIPLPALRNALVSYGAFDVEVVDLLFFVLRSVMRREGYTTVPDVGVPTLNFDAPRLLAHLFLFRADEYLKAAAGGEFLRWMDDIDIGVDSEVEGKRLVGELDGLLRKQGIRLNLQKTRILPSIGAADHFWVNENLCLNEADDLRKSSKHTHARRLLHRVAHSLRTKKREGEWAKVYARVLAGLGEIGDESLEHEASALLQDEPKLRQKALNYYRLIGYSAARMRRVMKYADSGHALDDASLLWCANLFVAWRIPKRSTMPSRLLNWAGRLGELAAREQRLGAIAAGLRVLVKHGSPSEIANFVEATQNAWIHSPWGSRQVAAVLGLLPPDSAAMVRDSIMSAGDGSATSVVWYFDHLCKTSRVDRNTRHWLLNGSPGRGQVERFLVVRTLLGSTTAQELSVDLAGRFIERVQDYQYGRTLKVHHGWSKGTAG